MTWHSSLHHIRGIALSKVYLSRKERVYEPGTGGGNYWKCQQLIVLVLIANGLNLYSVGVAKMGHLNYEYDSH